ncbi:MAG: NAD(P)H-dependent glycerol-3-phosphate dehydrogenase [Firmicutes bacterium]|jgi:glycerol-3-phosphate dehydrogenase (NAD(P)+)|nr:NAD(P)H-dependent glycerol-3-phosphate dehydrogenase [Bacillota bacterium]NLL88421.1 NAD(P)H-dependent glycerol-3-phosphate dehydrogenase [Bacillota bacterium]HKM18017.1 NAD(P)H-dependent glycerol-3-phosphate dehydrogenase [Limnochordia bacterium]
MNVTILGAGRWGAFLAWYLNRLGHQTMVWGRADSPNFAELVKTRRNEYLTLPPDVVLTTELDQAVEFGSMIIISIPSQNLRGLAHIINQYPVANKAFVLCMKGLEEDSGKRLTQVFNEEVTQNCSVAIWVGPGHVQDYLNGIPNCMVIGSDSINTTKALVQEFGSDLIRFYYGQDLIGNEVGAAAKNVIGVAAGLLDGLNYSSLKGALMARGAREISRLVRAMGGNELTVYGLSHLGDYSATLYSPYSHNRAFGEAFVQGRRFTKLAEGVATCRALMLLAERYEIELPICDSVHQIINEKKDAKEVLLNLYLRPVKFEF